MIRLSLLFALLTLSAALLAADPPGKPYDPRINPASGAGLKAMKGIRVPGGMKIELFAAEPMLANPVAFCIDHKNRYYVAETYRLHDGVTDIRGHMDWLDGD